MPAGEFLVHPGIARRLAAMAYELLLLLALLALTLVFPQVVIAASTHRVATPTTLWAHLFLVLLIYFVGFWSHGGQTLAMKTWRLRLLTRDGHGVRPTQALLRYLLCWISVGALGAGIVWALFDRDGLFLHDRIAGTQLVMA